MCSPAPSLRPIAFLTLLILLSSLAPLQAKIAVFVDGRILKVEDAYLEDERIVLVLGDGGWIKVPATRIDRVVADEVVRPDQVASAADPSCGPGWRDHPLPHDLPFAELIAGAARRADLHPRLLASLVRAESAFDPFAVSRVGAQGLTQLMPATAADHGVVDAFDPAENLRGGATHLRRLLDRFPSLPLALAAYNAGAATVDREGGIPPYRETHDFVRRVLVAFCDSDDGS